MTNPPRVGSHNSAAYPTKGSASVRRGKSDVSLMPPVLQRPHDLVPDGKSSEARRAPVGRQKARRCQANHKKIALRCRAAGDGRSTQWQAEGDQQLLAYRKVCCPRRAWRALVIDHGVRTILLSIRHIVLFNTHPSQASKSCRSGEIVPQRVGQIFQQLVGKYTPSLMG
jgi:hypothetical protein